MPDKKNDNNDFNLDSFLDEGNEFQDLFDNQEDIKKSSQPLSAPDICQKRPDYQVNKKRTISDFEPNMDALLMTAQSSMINEGINYFNKNNFTPKALPIYVEAMKGVDFYIKIMDRNPNNYRKLKALIDSDPDCQYVEKFAFKLYAESHEELPDTDKEKIEAFEMLHKLFADAKNKASISKTMIILRKYFLMSGGLDTDKIYTDIHNSANEAKRDFAAILQHLKLALVLVKRGKGEITEGLKGKDLNVFVIRASELLSYYCRLQNNEKAADYYERINSLYKRYYVVKE